MRGASEADLEGVEASVPRGQASAGSAVLGLCQGARIMARGGYSAMMTTGLSAGRWRTRLPAVRQPSWKAL